MPSVLADLLLRRDPPVRHTSELLSCAMEVRDSSAGLAFQDWFKQLRGALGDGTYATSARQDIQRVQREAEQRLRGPYLKWGMTMTPSVTASLSVISAKFEGKPARVGIPDWIRNWMLDTLPFGRHRKLLLRWSLAHAEFRDISQRVRNLWEAS